LAKADGVPGQTYAITASAGNLSGTAALHINAAPTIATPAAVSAAMVTDTCINASVLGADDDAETKLIYTWSATGPAAVTFSTNAANLAKATTVTFTTPGAYLLKVVLKDALNLTATSSVPVQVVATAARVVVTPATVARDPLTTWQFSAQAYDQFNALLTSQPAFTWSAQGLSINASGQATADGDAGASYTVLATAGSIFGSAILQINSVPTPPAPVITPAGGSFSEPLSVTISGAVPAPLPNTPGWRTGVKYPGQAIESVEALSQDGATVAAMRGRTAAKSMYLFPGANMSPAIGSFPFYIWSLSDAGDTTRHTTFYVPSLFVGVTDNTAWDGNNYDFYFGEMGNRVFLLLEQHYRKAITLWSCAAGVTQYTTDQQQLAVIPFTNVAALATTPLKMDFSAGKVRVLMGGAPLVSDATDANGWVTYIGPSASGRVNAPLGDTRFWFSLAGGEKAGPREFVVSDQPLVTTRYTYDGSDVTESSLVVTGKLTLTHDVTLKARSFSAAYPAPSEQTAASFDALLPDLPAESYVSPAYVDLYHATLDGSPALVSMDGPSGTIYGMPLADHRFVLRYPLSATEPTPVTLHRSGIPDLSTNIIWRTIDLGQESHPDSFPLRLGESLKLTAGAGETGTLQIVLYTVTNLVYHWDGITHTVASNVLYRTYEGQPGDEIPVLFDQPGAITAVAYVNGVSVGSLLGAVVYVNFDGPIACQVGFERTKGVEVFGPLDQVFFTNKNANLQVRVLYPEPFGVRLGLKPTSRREPVIVQARLGSVTGPILAEQKIDAFEVDYSPLQHMVVNDDLDIGSSHMTMRPWIPNLYLRCNMYAGYSFFADGSGKYTINTSDFTTKTALGEPVVELEVNSETGETQAVIRLEFAMPSGDYPDQNDSYCFAFNFLQHSRLLSASGPQINNEWIEKDVGGMQQAGGGICNGKPCRWKLSKAYWAEDAKEADGQTRNTKIVLAKCIKGNYLSHTFGCIEPGFQVTSTAPGNPTCTPGDQYNISVKMTEKKKGTYNLLNNGADFAVLYVARVDIDKCAKDWLPQGGDEDNNTTMKAKVSPAGTKGGTFEFELPTADVSDEPGYCMNMPTSPVTGATTQDSTQWKDLQFKVTQNNLTVSGISDFHKTATTQNGVELTDQSVVVECFDYGAFGKIKAKWTVTSEAGETTQVRGKETGTEQEYTTIPLDANGDHIADCASQDTSAGGSATDDEDEAPTGTNVKGDRISRYQEYRGFMIRPLPKSSDPAADTTSPMGHIRTPVDKKDVFFCQQEEIGHQDYWTSQNLTAPIRKIYENQMKALDHEVTINRETADIQAPTTSSPLGTTCCAIYQVRETDYQIRKRYRVGWGCTFATPSVPSDVSVCYIYDDSAKYGIRSGSELAEAVAAGSTNIVVKKPLGAANNDPYFEWASSGKTKIGSDVIAWSQPPAVDDANFKITFTLSAPLGQAHAAGDKVDYFFNPDEVIKLIVAHEAGHACNMNEDPAGAPTSIMEQVKAGSFGFAGDRLKFRDSQAGQPTAGTLKEFQTK
jgi:hypothetical protein